jgi:hypothetical protein
MADNGHGQGCYGLQKRFTICKIADTIPKNLQMGSWLQNCRYHSKNLADGKLAAKLQICF